MAGTFSVIFSLALGLVLAYFGIEYIAHKRYTMNADALPAVRFLWLFKPYSLRGPRAIVFGSACIVGGVLVVLPWIMGVVVHHNTAPTDDVVIFAAMTGLAVAVFGFVLATFFEFLNTLRLLSARRAASRQKKAAGSKK